MHCCKHHGKRVVDDTISEDGFTQAAIAERRIRTAHAHGAALALTVLGGILFFGIARRLFGRS